ncbi:MAG: esterase family protein [Chloroflexi bacterium]|nr:esterase family protein [Chloroflexota bacterium]
MVKRQAKKLILLIFALLSAIWACAPLNEARPVPTRAPAPSPLPTVVPSATATPFLAPTHTSTPLPCLGQPGQVEIVALDAPALPQFRIYLPPCYAVDSTRRYPVLYLIHGQGYTDEQWARLGVPSTADRLIASGEMSPFIIVMPYDKASWKLAPDDFFGEALINDLLPYVDEHYRTLADREQRAIGGLSRGAGWSIHYGLTRWDLFGAFGAHSPAIFYNDGPKLDEWVAAIPSAAWPRIYIDIGDNDTERGYALKFDDILTQYGLPHEWHLYRGVHDEAYWRAHVEEYLLWYGGTFER